VRTNPSNEALGQHGLQGRCDQKWLHAHIDEAGDRARRHRSCASVESTKVTGQRRLDGDLRGLKVANLTDHDDVWILPEKRAGVPRPKVSPHERVHRHLHQCLDLVFDGIFGGEDLDVGRVYDAQAAVERRSFARPRRTGDDEDTVGPADDVVDAVEDVDGHPQLGDVELDGRLIEHAEHDALTELRRERGDAQVNLAAADALS